MHRIEEIKKLKDRFIGIACAALDKGAECVDTAEMGQVIDMIKDLAEAEKDCMKAKYYFTLIQAMEEYEDEDWMEDMTEDLEEMGNERRGYRGRSKRSGRYVHRSTPTRDSGSPMSMAGTGSSSRGYPMYPDPDKYAHWPQNQPNMPHWDRYGKPYHDWMDSKRRFTETKANPDKDAMSRHAKEHLNDVTETVKEMWHESDPELRKQMKTQITNLLAEMN